MIVDFNKLPKEYGILRGSTVTHIFVYSKPLTRDTEEFNVNGNFLCDERNFHTLHNIQMPNLYCKKCIKFYDEVVSGEIKYKYNNRYI